MAANGLAASPVNEILIERSIAGWKEYELEVMRDRADNCVIICSIENLDPMGVHTGDSITVAPAQTLSDVEYQLMRDAAFACIRRVGVETGGSNVQFALDPTNGDMVIIEMNPRVSRSSALASKATGLPDRQDRRQARGRVHARRDPQRHHQGHAGQLRADHRLRRHQGAALGLREVPRHAGRARHVDAVGGRGDGHRPHLPGVAAEGDALARARAARPGAAIPARRRSTTSTTRSSSRRAAIGTPDRPFQLEAALRRGISVEVLAERTKVDPWFLDQLLAIVEERAALAEIGFDGMDRRAWRRAKRLGFCRRPAGLAVVGPRGRRAGGPAGGRRAGHVQDRRHLRGRVRGGDAVPLLHLRGRGRGHATPVAEKVLILGSGPEPHRPGHRVRLLLRPRQLRPRATPATRR